VNTIVGLVILLAGLAVLGVVLVGIGYGVLWLWTVVFHALRPEEMPGPLDADWDRDQGREAR
jgi:hypothetical protein